MFLCLPANEVLERQLVSPQTHLLYINLKILKMKQYLIKLRIVTIGGIALQCQTDLTSHVHRLFRRIFEHYGESELRMVIYGCDRIISTVHGFKRLNSNSVKPIFLPPIIIVTLSTELKQKKIQLISNKTVGIE